MEIWKCIIFFAVFVLRQKRARVLHLEGNSFRVCTYAPRIYLNRPRNLSRSRINLWFQNFNAVSSLSHSLSLSSHYCCSGTARAVFTLFVARQSSECLQESEKVYTYKLHVMRAEFLEIAIHIHRRPAAIYGFCLSLCNTINQRDFTFQILAILACARVKQPLKI